MNKLIFGIIFLMALSANAQQFTRQDSLRGSITPERSWWDLQYYHLKVEVFPEEKKIKGSNVIKYEVLKPHQLIQIDLQAPLTITKVMEAGKRLKVRSEGNAHFIKLEKKQVTGAVNSIEVFYEGLPKEAVRAPWDGGFSWKKDSAGNHFIATSCQGLGASVWWPCKDHMSDEVKGMDITVTIPEDLQDVSNGRLIKIDHNKKDKTKTYHWKVVNPINNYGVNLNIGDYVNWKEEYNGEKGKLDVDYWALRVDEVKAKEQFKEVPRMLEAFEHWFGPYPFYEDGYKLVQAPYLGMEHQSSITYGNKFMQGYLGRDLSTTGWGLKFDFIIVHESGHEWFANNITHKDMADMWLHESFTNYSESLFLDYHYGKEAGQEYVRGTRTGIQNIKPMIGQYGVNDETYPGDVYNKGGNMLNTIRTIVDNDEKWRGLLRSVNEVFYHKTITSKEMEEHIASYLDMDMKVFFEQYLRQSNLPILEYYYKDGVIKYRWTSVINGFIMPVDIWVGQERMRLDPTLSWQEFKTEEKDIKPDENYYIGVLKSR